MKKFLLFVLVLIIVATIGFTIQNRTPQAKASVDNNILLMISKVDYANYKLEWADMNIPASNPAVFKVYRSTKANTLGTKIATVHGYEFVDHVANPYDSNIYYYQILRVTD